MCSESRDLLKIFCEIGDNISKTVQDKDKVAMESYMAYRMAPLNDLEGLFAF